MSVKTQQKVRSKRTTNKKRATAKKQKRSKGTLTTQQIKDRTICNGNVVLFRRENSKRWQCRIRRNTGVWVDYSTKQTDLKKTKKVAEERYRGIKYRHETGKIDVTHRFSDVCKLAKKTCLRNMNPQIEYLQVINHPALFVNEKLIVGSLAVYIDLGHNGIHGEFVGYCYQSFLRPLTRFTRKTIKEKLALMMLYPFRSFWGTINSPKNASLVTQSWSFFRYC